jgi:hypothetical protein
MVNSLKFMGYLFMESFIYICGPQATEMSESQTIIGECNRKFVCGRMVFPYMEPVDKFV